MKKNLDSMQYKCLTIAGFDGSGGAGIQADTKVFSALGCYAMNVITAIPVQNTCGVRKCYSIPLEAVFEQLEAIFDDIMPDAIKIGMLFSAEIIITVSNFLKRRAQNIPIIIDPVMRAKSGDLLLEEDAVHSLKTELIPLAFLVTPNLLEAHSLAGCQENKRDLANYILALKCKNVLIKGGHDNDQDFSNDLLVESNGKETLLTHERIITKNCHGTGCTLSAAITAYIAQGYSLLESCQKAKDYLSNAMIANKDAMIGKGTGPVHHFFHWWN